MIRLKKKLLLMGGHCRASGSGGILFDISHVKPACFSVMARAVNAI